MSTVAITPASDVMFTQLKALLTTLSGFDTDHIVKRAPGDVSMPSSPFIQMMALDEENLTFPVSSWDTTSNILPVSIQYQEDMSTRVQVEFVGQGSEDLSRGFSTVFTSEFGVQALGPSCAPLKILSRNMVPIDTAEKNNETRWIVRVSIETQPVVELPQQFATAAVATTTIADSNEM